MESKRVLLLIADAQSIDIEKAFRKANFEVLRTDDPAKGLDLLKLRSPHAVIVDWDLTDGAIGEVARVIQENCRKTGLILISKNNNPEERIQALEEGADDCLYRPQELDELVAKVIAIIRRIELVDEAPKKLVVKDIEINLSSHAVLKGDRVIDLTYTQFKLLYLLASRRNYVFTREEILNLVWGENVYVTDRTVDVHVKRLREKLGISRDHLPYIQTIHGLGYRFA